MFDTEDSMAQANVEAAEQAQAALEGELAEYVGLFNAAAGRIVELMGDALERDLWQGWDIHSPRHWLAWQAGMSPLHARQIVTLAERSAELPTAVAALVAGTMSLDQAAEVARHVPAAFDESVSELAPHCTVAQLRRLLPKYQFMADADDARADAGDAQPEAAAGEHSGDHDETNDGDASSAAGADGGHHDDGDPGPDETPSTDPAGTGTSAGAGQPIDETRELSMGIDDDGTWWMRARLPVDEGAVLEAAIRATRDDLYRQACDGLEDDDPRPQLSLVDALLGVAETAMRSAEAAHPGSDRYLIYAHLEAGPSDDQIGLASLHLGPILPDHLRRLLTCDGTIRPVLERNATPVNVGRDERIVPRRIRRLIEHRDDGCAVPGCARRSALQIHHIIHWEDGGATDTHNLLCLCATHHRLHHRNLLAITGNADVGTGPGGVCFRDKWGRVLDPTGTPVAPTPQGSLHQAAEAAGVATNPYQRPYGERLDTDAVIFWPNRTHLDPPRPPLQKPDPPSENPPSDEDATATEPPSRRTKVEETPADQPGRANPATPPRAGPDQTHRAA